MRRMSSAGLATLFGNVPYNGAGKPRIFRGWFHCFDLFMPLAMQLGGVDVMGLGGATIDNRFSL